MGALDDADSVPMCGGNDENLYEWWLADVVSTGHMNNRNGSGSVLAVRNHSFCWWAPPLEAMAGIVQGRSIVSAVYRVVIVRGGDKRSGFHPYGANVPLGQHHQKRPRTDKKGQLGLVIAPNSPLAAIAVL